MASATVENREIHGIPTGGEASDGPGTVNHDDIGPMQEYDRRVEDGLLRNDEHQRGEEPTGPTTNHYVC